MDPWGDGSPYVLRSSPFLTGWPRVINVVGTRGIYLVVHLVVRSVPSSSVPFPLYKPAFVTLTFYFYRNFTIRALPSTLTDEYNVYLIHQSSTLCYCLSSSGKYPSLKFIIIFFGFPTVVIYVRSISVLGFTVTYR